MSGYRDLPIWQASSAQDRRIIERTWNEIPDTVPEWVRQVVASFAPWSEHCYQAAAEFVIHLSQVLTPDRVITSATDEYNRMAEINRR